MEHEQRRFPRMSIHDPAHGLHLRAQGRELPGARLVNLSAGGCGLELPILDAQTLEVGDALEAVTLDHPDLPLVPLPGTVVRLLGKLPGKCTGYVLVGVEFREITPFVQSLIARYVAHQLGQA